MKLISVKLDKKQKIITGIVVGFLAVILIGVICAKLFIKAPEMVQPSTTVIDPLTGEESSSGTLTAQKTGEVYTFLVAGRDYAGLNTDTIMVVSFDTENDTLNVVSIPRDTMSADTSRTNKKINAAYAVGGSANPEQLLLEIEQIIGVPIDRYMVVNLDVFETAIDLLDGIEIDVPWRMYYTDTYQGLYIDLYPGVQVLNGSDAVGFVRWRQNNDGTGYATGDLGRIDTQQLFLEALIETVLTPSTVTKIPDLIGTLLESVDTNFTLGEIAWLATEGLEVDLENNLNFFMLPGYDRYAYSLSYYFVKPVEWLEMLNEYFNPLDGDIVLTDLNVVTEPPAGSQTSTTSSSDEDEDEDAEDQTEVETDDTTSTDPETGTSSGSSSSGSSSSSGDSSSSSDDTSEPNTDTGEVEDSSDDEVTTDDETSTESETTTDDTVVEEPVVEDTSSEDKAGDTGASFDPEQS